MLVKFSSSDVTTIWSPIAGTAHGALRPIYEIDTSESAPSNAGIFTRISPVVELE
jgi:hypothetical protein